MTDEEYEFYAQPENQRPQGDPIRRRRPARRDEAEAEAAAGRVDGLDEVLARARQVWGDDAAAAWMEGCNAHLGGARPIDVLTISGAEPVLRALDAEAGGGFA